ncbi:hypothetical protein [Pseudomonas sp. B21-053]|uniref:hypothetical protein n=1 Tax=Pseudomonas sp. B21-053 TaxID=2895493 RepID=UPI00222E60E9|nr:hypothetical protein [Pseudomonas sp. B21-053]UZE10834.1 hypothetical protein LOY68_25600 [Pseudomonas sp. B21-053]
MNADSRRQEHAVHIPKQRQRPAIDIPGALFFADSATQGVNQAMVKAPGLQVNIDSDSVKPGDSVLVYIDDRLVLVLPVKVDYAREPIIQYIPARLIPEGLITVTYRVNLEWSVPLKVMVKTRLPGGIDPDLNAPGHSLLAAPQLSATLLSGLQDETVTVAPYQNMSSGDVVTLVFGRSAIPHTVKANEVTKPLTFTLLKGMFAENGHGEIVLYYRIVDQFGNSATAHSAGLSVMIQSDADEPAPPRVAGVDEQSILYLSQLGSQTLDIHLDTQDFGSGDTLTLHWLGLDRTGEAHVLTETQTLKIQSALSFKIANADIQTLAGGSARLFFTRTDGNGDIQPLPSREILIVGNTRRVSEPESGSSGSSGSTLSEPESGVLRIDVPIIQGSTVPVVGAHCGVSIRIYDDQDPNGAQVVIDPLIDGAALDVIDLILNDNIIDTLIVAEGEENARHLMKIPNHQLNPYAVNFLVAIVSRVGGNADFSEPPLSILYNEIRPGNKDLDTGPGHSELQLKLPQDIIDNGLDAARALQDVEVSFCYPYCRAYDIIELRLGNSTLRFTVSPSEAPEFGESTPLCIERTLIAQNFKDAGDSPEFVFSYTVHDQITNGADPSDPYSPPIFIDVDLAGVRRPAPEFFDNPNDADSNSIDLEQMGSDDLIMLVRAATSQFAVGDTIDARYSSPPSPDFLVSGTLTGQFNRPVPLPLLVPNNLVISGRRVTGSYVQSRNGVFIANSVIANTRVIGSGIPDLPPPVVILAPGGVLEPKDNPQGAIGRVEIPGFRPGDQVQLIVRGAPGAGSPAFTPVDLDDNGLASFPLSTAFIKANRGRVVIVSYMFIRGTRQLPSRELTLIVNNASEQPEITSVTAGGATVVDRGSTYYRTLAISGTAEAGTEVEVIDNLSNSLGRFPVNASGIWTVLERTFNVTTHTLTARTTDGSDLVSEPRAFTVLEGLVLEITNFYNPVYNGWQTGPAVGPNDLFFIFYPPFNQYVLFNNTNTNNSAGVVLYKDFNNLTPGRTYALTVNFARYPQLAAVPIVALRTNGATSANLTISHADPRHYTLNFIPSSPNDRLMISNVLATGTGNDYVIPWIQFQRLN